ncbi:hypothetical protein [Brachybacterium paraconglomeratum]|uniref:hypothetical protein n=1 Tax=Brachybacterium paraconglomeratum TaxID=173362 RepID=UPI0022E5545C|nr:hypothetical protein [Brachybacterium paraconglomeratum]
MSQSGSRNDTSSPGERSMLTAFVGARRRCAELDRTLIDRPQRTLSLAALRHANARSRFVN